MDFRFALDNALKNTSTAEMAEMCKTLGVERVDVSSFLNGSCALTHREIQQLLTYLGFRLERGES